LENKSMLKITLSAIAASLLALSLISNPAQAQPIRVFVAAQGSDSNPCSFAAPCRTFQHAHDVVAARGEINVLDPAGYGAVTITKSISIQGHDFSGISVPSAGIGITINGAPSDIINLRGLIIEGAGLGSNGIRFNSGQSLTVENCIVRNHTGDGFQFLPNGPSNLNLSTTLVTDNGGNGINIQPMGSGTVTAALSRVETYNNAAHGINVIGTFAAGNLDVTVADSVAAKNGFAGIIANSTSANTWVGFFRSVASNNDIGVATFGGGLSAGLFVSQSMIFRNQKGWSGDLGSLYSLGDNVSLNYTNDIPPTTVNKR
jgi:hypothetical protein